MSEDKMRGPDMGAARGPQIGRLALRHEGEMWNAYYAMTHTMKDALFLGGIRINAPEDRRTGFRLLMREYVGDLIFEIAGFRPVWDDGKPAPEHERAGHG